MDQHHLKLRTKFENRQSCQGSSWALVGRRGSGLRGTFVIGESESIWDFHLPHQYLLCRIYLGPKAIKFGLIFDHVQAFLERNRFRPESGPEFRTS